MSHWLIIYDIREPKRLTKIAKVMVNYGVRVQKSVFEAEADHRVIERLRKDVRNIIMEEEDYVVYFDVCERDWQKRMKYGPSRFEEPDEGPFRIL
jgi:CRISPR-associated protein Cas2